MSEVTWALLVFVAAGLTANPGVDNSHLGVHQPLLVRVPVVLVGVSGLDFDSGHLTNLVGVHQTELNRLDPLRDLGCIARAHLRSPSSSLIATPRLFISSSSNLNA